MSGSTREPREAWSEVGRQFEELGRLLREHFDAPDSATWRASDAPAPGGAGPDQPTAAADAGDGGTAGLLGGGHGPDRHGRGDGRGRRRDGPGCGRGHGYAARLAPGRTRVRRARGARPGRRPAAGRRSRTRCSG